MASSASELAALLPRELSALPLLGTGALSEVRLLARPNGLPPLALKATRKPLLAFTQQIDRLVAEHRVLQATCAAECPSSLARFVGALHDAERVYLFSEAVLAHGTQSVDLRQLLDARARLPPATRSLPAAAVARIADGLFGALQHLHGRRFAHRDVKPDNLLLEDLIMEPFFVEVFSGTGRLADAVRALGLRTIEVDLTEKVETKIC